MSSPSGNIAGLDHFALLVAERELSLLETVIQNADLSDVALNRALASIGRIRVVIEWRRAELCRSANWKAA